MGKSKLNLKVLLKEFLGNEKEHIKLSQKDGRDIIIFEKKNFYIYSDILSGIESRKKELYNVGDIYLFLCCPKNNYTYSYINSIGYKYISILERKKIIKTIENNEDSDEIKIDFYIIDKKQNTNLVEYINVEKEPIINIDIFESNEKIENAKKWNQSKLNTTNSAFNINFPEEKEEKEVKEEKEEKEENVISFDNAMKIYDSNEMLNSSVVYINNGHIYDSINGYETNKEIFKNKKRKYNFIEECGFFVLSNNPCFVNNREIYMIEESEQDNKSHNIFEFIKEESAPLINDTNTANITNEEYKRNELNVGNDKELNATKELDVTGNYKCNNSNKILHSYFEKQLNKDQDIKKFNSFSSFKESNMLGSATEKYGVSNVMEQPTLAAKNYRKQNIYMLLNIFREIEYIYAKIISETKGISLKCFDLKKQQPRMQTEIIYLNGEDVEKREEKKSEKKIYNRNNKNNQGKQNRKIMYEIKTNETNGIIGQPINNVEHVTNQNILNELFSASFKILKNMKTVSVKSDDALDQSFYNNVEWYLNYIYEGIMNREMSLDTVRENIYGMEVLVSDILGEHVNKNFKKIKIKKQPIIHNIGKLLEKIDSNKELIKSVAVKEINFKNTRYTMEKPTLDFTKIINALRRNPELENVKKICINGIKKNIVIDSGTPKTRPHKILKLIDEIHVKYKKRPIIIIPPNYIINKKNIKSFFVNNQLIMTESLGLESNEEKIKDKTNKNIKPINNKTNTNERVSIIYTMIKKQIKFVFVENDQINTLTDVEWKCVVAIILNPNQTLKQLNGYPFKSVKELTQNIKVYIFMFKDEKLSIDLSQQPFTILHLHKTDRSKDALAVHKFWHDLEKAMLQRRVKLFHFGKRLSL